VIPPPIDGSAAQRARPPARLSNVEHDSTDVIRSPGPWPDRAARGIPQTLPQAPEPALRVTELFQNDCRSVLRRRLVARRHEPRIAGQA